MAFWESIKRLFSKEEPQQRLSAAEEADLYAAFKLRYWHFTTLLGSNNKVLEIMADMEKMLHGKRSFGMDFVRANCTAISVNLYRMIKGINELGGGKYWRLFEAAKDVFGKIDTALAERKVLAGGAFVIPLDHVDETMAEQVGSKMANLGSIAKLSGVRVPEGFTVTVAAYERFIIYNKLQDEINRWISSVDLSDIEKLEKEASRIRAAILQTPLPPELEEAIKAAYRQLEGKTTPGVKVAARSSALGEDQHKATFAGQYRSILNVDGTNLVNAYKEVVASKYSLSAIAYRLNMGFRDEDIAMCVGVVAMVDPVASGVAYSRDPEDFRKDQIIINATWGLAKAVVDGTTSPDLFVLSHTKPVKILAKTIRPKGIKLVPAAGGGLGAVEVPEKEREVPSVTDEQALFLAEICSRLEAHFGGAQDVEWSITGDGSVVILQCRPLIRLKSSMERRKPVIPSEENGPEPLLYGDITASPGVAAGPAFLLQHEDDMAHFPDGAVMVTKFAYPRWAAILHKAAAVVAEQGGVAGHLATVSREFGVPALVGVPAAATKIKNGDLITVDADNGRIYSGRIESLLGVRPERLSLMKGSPIYRTLEQVLTNITPLNLTDPDSVDFTPSKCRTVHDITRFIHEVSVREMFESGDQYHLSQRASKRLVCGVPMQWWVVDLEDGFKVPVEGKRVSIDNIASIPMLALWEGITAIPWKGPAVDTRGMVSVMFEATMRPEIGPDTGANFAERNYFMISRHFCNLSSKLGFHFSTVEAFVGDIPGENYASFIFKGGAADVTRRQRRVAFIGEILSRFDFRVEAKEDVVSARLEGCDQEFLKERLKVLGYLVLHTRQMDMIMSNEALVNYYLKKMLDDIYSFVKIERKEENTAPILGLKS
ncbi:MAG: PEP/pyruvate-binding domain-containing protein [Desulfovibrionales bacterium]|nr:PEP/pyruvate-binding domain-containing protein [Desulfovibrionales bacterium]